MSKEHNLPDENDDDSTEETQAAVSRLLGDASGPMTMPGEVRERLDVTLADLVAQRGTGAAPVTTLSGRRRRTGSRLLLAAAAVGVAGVGVGALLDSDLLQGGAHSDSATAGAADSGSTDSLGEAPATEDQSEGGGAYQSGSDGAPGSSDRLRALAQSTLRLNRQNLERRLAMAGLLGGAVADLNSRAAQSHAKGSIAEKSGCLSPGLAPGESRWIVQYEGEPASLVTRRDGRRHIEARVYDCTYGLFLDGARVRVR